MCQSYTISKEQSCHSNTNSKNNALNQSKIPLLYALFKLFPLSVHTSWHTLLIARTWISHPVTRHLWERLVSNQRSSFLGIYCPLKTIVALVGELWSGRKWLETRAWGTGEKGQELESPGLYLPVSFSSALSVSLHIEEAERVQTKPLLLQLFLLQV